MESGFGRITTKGAREAGYPYSLLSSLMDDGLIIRESRGVYALPETPLDDFAVIALRWPRVVFSGETALYLNGMTDKVSSRFNVTVPRRYDAPLLKEEYPTIEVHHAIDGRFELGIEDSLSPTGAPIRVYDPERCICELLKSKRQGRSDARMLKEALEAYLAMNRCNLPKLARYAKTLGVEQDLQPYTEVLA